LDVSDSAACRDDGFGLFWGFGALLGFWVIISYLRLYATSIFDNNVFIKRVSSSFFGKISMVF